MLLQCAATRWRMPLSIGFVRPRPAAQVVGFHPRRLRPLRRLSRKTAQTLPARRERSQPRQQLLTQPLPASTEQTAQNIINERKWPLLGAGVIAAGLGLYISLLLPSLLSPTSCQHSVETKAPLGRPPALTGESAAKFDKSLDGPEWLTGITSLRRRVAAEAHGHILEVAVGTGRNVGFYDWSGLDESIAKTTPQGPNLEKRSGLGLGTARSTNEENSVASFTGVDISLDMLNVALSKLARSVLSRRETAAPVITRDGDDSDGISYLSGRVRLLRRDAQLPLPPRCIGPSDDSTEGKYDTAIQTFGLCSVSDPSAVLVGLAAAIQPDTGRIILLEHGRGTWGWVNKLLDRQAFAHFSKYGCWWNRDIEAVLRDAVEQVPGLEIVRLERPYALQMGTLLYAELRVNSRATTH